ncbi:MAG: riboflavin synthase [Rickettsiales bacterium]|nr:riboflavin synthase [Rickettsiales bacterium]
MFTGIITNIATVEELNYNKNKDLLFKISLKEKIKRKLEIGCSIACNGVCLTLIDKKISAKNTALSFQVSQETLAKTNFKELKINDLINIEFSMRLGDEFGGHMVLGHVDNVIKIKKIEKIKDSHKFTFLANKSLIKFIAKKGSVTLNGVSLTVNEVNGNSFSVNLIKHTIDNTSFKFSKINDLVNFEIDLITRIIKQQIK